MSWWLTCFSSSWFLASNSVSVWKVIISSWCDLVNNSDSSRDFTENNSKTREVICSLVFCSRKITTICIEDLMKVPELQLGWNESFLSSHPVNLITFLRAFFTQKWWITAILRHYACWFLNLNLPEKNSEPDKWYLSAH